MGNHQRLEQGACQETSCHARADLKNEVALGQHCAKPAQLGPSNELERAGRLLGAGGGGGVITVTAWPSPANPSASNFACTPDPPM